MEEAHKVVRISKTDNLSSSQFAERIFLENRPCILSEDYTSQWNSRKDWVLHGKPHFSYLHDTYGQEMVPVVHCGKQFFNSHEKSEMQFSKFIAYWRDMCDQPQDLQEDYFEPNLIYLKDWHFQRQHPDYKAYQVPIYFQQDWLNEYWDLDKETEDDYRFVYMGPKGSWTPFHADVFRSFSWSANVCGRKKWLLFPPGEENKLRDRNGHLPFDVTADEASDVTLRLRVLEACHPIVITQCAGEIIFVPSGWYHQVHNLEDTISINHNWTNAYGIHKMWAHLRSELALVKHEIEDCRDMEGWHSQCQVIMKANTGMNFEGFCKMLRQLQFRRAGAARKIGKMLSEPLTKSSAHQIEGTLAMFKITAIPRWLTSESVIGDRPLQLQGTLEERPVCCFCISDNLECRYDRSSLQCICADFVESLLPRLACFPAVADAFRILLYELRVFQSVLQSLFEDEDFVLLHTEAGN